MNPRDEDDGTLNTLPWRVFLEHAEKFGVEIIETTALGSTGRKGKYLFREVEGLELWCGLPSDFDIEGRIGPLLYFNVCRRLSLDKNLIQRPVIL